LRAEVGHLILRVHAAFGLLAVAAACSNASNSGSGREQGTLYDPDASDSTVTESGSGDSNIPGCDAVPVEDQLCASINGGHVFVCENDADIGGRACTSTGGDYPVDASLFAYCCK
jgi:hypothetical protein